MKWRSIKRAAFARRASTCRECIWLGDDLTARPSSTRAVREFLRRFEPLRLSGAFVPRDYEWLRRRRAPSRPAHRLLPLRMAIDENFLLLEVRPSRFF